MYKINTFKMSKNVLKFGTKDTLKFIEIYRNYECLWDQQHKDYKNRKARDEALKLFASKLAIEDFGPKEIVTKIKNIRSQYLQELKKIKASLSTGVESNKIYTPKLPWFQSMDSFMRNVIEGRRPFSNSNYLKEDTKAIILDDSSWDSCEENHTSDDPLGNQSTVAGFRDIIPERRISRKRKNVDPDGDHVTVTSNRVDEIEERSSLQNDDLSAFGNYVVSTLRKLSARNCVSAQDEIYITLSRYKLRQLEESELSPSTSR